MSRLRVLHVIPSVGKHDGGPSRAIELMAQALAGSDVVMEIATTDDDGPGRRLPGPFDADGVAADPLSGSALRRHFPKRSEFYKFSPALARWLSRQVRNYDVVHIHALFSFSSVAAAFIARRAGVPYVVRPLGTLNEYGMTQRRPWLKRLSLRWIEGPILRHAASVQFTAEAERVQADALGIPMRGVVIPLAVDAPGEPDGPAWQARFPMLGTRRYVLFLSRIDPKKNLEALLDAMAALARDHAERMLVVAGDGEAGYVAGLKRRAETLGIAARVVWTGFLDGGMKSAALKGAAVFALPSYSENFGIAAAEALLLGLPCVLGRGVAIAGDIEAAGAGIAVEPEAAAIATALSVYLDDEPARLRAADAARRYAMAEYSVATLGNELRELYWSVLASRGDRNDRT